MGTKGTKEEKEETTPGGQGGEKNPALYRPVEALQANHTRHPRPDYGVFLRISAGWTLVRAIATAVTMLSPHSGRQFDGEESGWAASVSPRRGASEHFRAGQGCQGRFRSLSHSSRTQLLLRLPAGQLYTPDIPGSAPDLRCRKRSRVWDDEKRRAKDPPSRRIIKKNALCGRVVPG